MRGGSSANASDRSARKRGEGKEGEIYLSVYAREGVSEVDLSGVGGPNPASFDGSRHRIQPGNGNL